MSHPRSAFCSPRFLTQQERHRVGVEEVEELAALLGLSTATVEGVARYYDQISREPTGSHVLSLCRGIACYLHGAEARVDELRAALGAGPGETTADGRVTFKLVECIGDCDHAPAVMLDGQFLGAATGRQAYAVAQSALGGRSQESNGSSRNMSATRARRAWPWPGNTGPTRACARPSACLRLR